MAVRLTTMRESVYMCYESSGEYKAHLSFLSTNRKILMYRVSTIYTDLMQMRSVKKPSNRSWLIPVHHTAYLYPSLTQLHGVRTTDISDTIGHRRQRPIQ